MSGPSRPDSELAAGAFSVAGCRANPKYQSLAVAADMTGRPGSARGYVNANGKEFSAASVRSMLA